MALKLSWHSLSSFIKRTPIFILFLALTTRNSILIQLFKLPQIKTLFASIVFIYKLERLSENSFKTRYALRVIFHMVTEVYYHSQLDQWCATFLHLRPP